MLGGLDETIALVEVWHFLFISLSWLGVNCVGGRGHGVAVVHRDGRADVVEDRVDLSLGGFDGGIRLLLHPLRGREHGRVDLGVEVVERLLRCRIEPGERQLDRLLLVVEDGERLANLLQAAGRENVIVATRLEAHADRFRPLDEVLREILVLPPKRLHLADDDTSLHGLVRVVLLKPVGEAVKVGFVQAARTHEPIRLALALRVGSRHHIEAGSGLDIQTDLLEEHALALKHGLKAHHALRPEVDLVKQQDRAPLHRLNHAAEHELRFAVDEAEPAKQIVLVRFGGDVDADEFPSAVGADLFDHGGLAVAAHARDVDGSELLGGEDRADVLVVTPRNESVVLDGDEVQVGRGRHGEVVGVAVHVGDCIRSGTGSHEIFVRVFNLFFGVGQGDFHGDHLRDLVVSPISTASRVLGEPSRENLVAILAP